MRGIACVSVILALLFGNIVLAELPEGSNVYNAWYRGTMDDIRTFYGYSSPEPENFHCRLDYYHDGRIRLLAVEGFYHIKNSPVSTVTTFYFLRPNTDHESRGHELVRISYKTMSGPDLTVKPILVSEDPFTKRCVPLLKDLFNQIHPQETRMFKNQYGELFGIQ